MDNNYYVQKSMSVDKKSLRQGLVSSFGMIGNLMDDLNSAGFELDIILNQQDATLMYFSIRLNNKHIADFKQLTDNQIQISNTDNLNTLSKEQFDLIIKYL